MENLEISRNAEKSYSLAQLHNAKLADTKSIAGGELLKVVSFVFSIPVSNSSSERTFSVMNSLWTKERNRLGLGLLRAELQVCENLKYKCSEFYDFLIKNQDCWLLQDLMRNILLSASSLHQSPKALWTKVNDQLNN